MFTTICAKLFRIGFNAYFGIEADTNFKPKYQYISLIYCSPILFTLGLGNNHLSVTLTIHLYSSTFLQSANHVGAVQCMNSCIYRSHASVNVHVKHQYVENI